MSQRQINRVTFAGCLVAGCGMLLACSANAQDHVRYLPENATRPFTVSGRILEYDGQHLTMQPLSGVIQSIPSEQIESIETQYLPSHLKGLELLQQGETRAAALALRDAVQLEPRDWVKREILAGIVKCALREEDLLTAINAFRDIAISDPQTRHWGSAPLVWSPQVISADVRRLAQRWLKSSSEADRFLAASLLLLDASEADAAQQAMEQLSHITNPRISDLAKAQLWRLELATREISPVMLGSWQRHLEYLPDSLRSGPQYLLARGWEIRGELRLAAAEWMWIPIVYSENEVLSARALWDAGDALTRSGMNLEAQAITRELLQRYPWSREARQIRSATEAFWQPHRGRQTSQGSSVTALLWPGHQESLLRLEFSNRPAAWKSRREISPTADRFPTKRGRENLLRKAA